ncbi:MAG: hypothetical protein LBF15_03355 [Candidatus Peribacteria bacterium]|jgi:hypothetical protein|nr:hypothetical protein [Candidatus Peribacteria bacterium]
MLLLTDKYLKNFTLKTKDLSDKITQFKTNSKELSFDYLLNASSVYSSNIE